MNWQLVPIPKRMRALERDRRGFPVPFIVLRDKHNKPHFAINDNLRVLRCIKERRCAICGGRMQQTLWFVGGPNNAFHPNGAYLDTPLHQECMTYALQVCPYLAMPSYTGSVGVGSLTPDKYPSELVGLVDHTVLPDRPPVFVAVEAKTMTVNSSNNSVGTFVVHPDRPYLSLQFWRGGELIPQEQGRKLAIEYMREVVATGKVAAL